MQNAVIFRKNVCCDPSEPKNIVVILVKIKWTLHLRRFWKTNILPDSALKSVGSQIGSLNFSTLECSIVVL